MKKILLAGFGFIVILFSPLTDSWAGGYSSSPSIYFGISWENPTYNKVWVPGYWELWRGERIWVEGYWGEKRYSKKYRSADKRRRHRSRAYWVPGHREFRYGHGVWVAEYWGGKHRPEHYYPSKKSEKRSHYWKNHDRYYYPW